MKIKGKFLKQIIRNFQIILEQKTHNPNNIVNLTPTVELEKSRCLSILSFFTKITEKVVYKKLKKYLF